MKIKRLQMRPRARAPSADPWNIYGPQSEEETRAIRVAISIAVAFHVFLFVVRFAGAPRPYLPENRAIPLIFPILKLSGAGSQQAPQASPGRDGSLRRAQRAIPFPDPTPADPEPLYESVSSLVPEIISEIGTILPAGQVASPSGPGLNGTRNGTTSGDDGIETFVQRIGLTAPVPILRPLPYYTEEARKARIEGIVLVECIVRKDGTVDTIRVIRGLGHGLNESAVQTIATEWRFKPGAYSGQPVDVQAYVEVSFRLF